MFVWILSEWEKPPSVRKIWISYFYLRARTHALKGTWINTTLEKTHRKISIWKQLYLISLSFNLLCVGVTRKPGKGLLFLFTGYYALCVQTLELLYLFNELPVIYKYYKYYNTFNIVIYKYYKYYLSAL